MSQGNSTDDVNEALLALVNALEARDSYSKDHSIRVGNIVKQLTARFKISNEEKQIIYNAALLHDIGMVSIPDAVLLKKSCLSPEERQLIQQAPQVAAKILTSITSLRQERLIILHHGERWDGGGYPDNLKAAQIPEGSRFITVAKAIDAMTRNRAYRRARPISYCLEQLKEHAGTQFDPKIATVAASILCTGILAH